MHNGMMPFYLDKIIKGNRGLMSPDNRLFADNTRGVKDINNTHLIISGGITKLSKTSGIFRYFNLCKWFIVKKTLNIAKSKRIIHRGDIDYYYWLCFLYTLFTYNTIRHDGFF